MSADVGDKRLIGGGREVILVTSYENRVPDKIAEKAGSKKSGGKEWVVPPIIVTYFAHCQPVVDCKGKEEKKEQY